MSTEASAYKELETADLHNTPQQIQRAEQVYGGRSGKMTEEPPGKVEAVVWYVYGFCSHFVHTLLLPVVFPLILSQMHDAPEPGRRTSAIGRPCTPNSLALYQALTHRSISVGDANFSPLEWNSVSWASGVILAAPLLARIAFHLDYGHRQPLISAIAITLGAVFCFPAGFFRSPWPLLPYAAAIVAAQTVAFAAHTRHLGLMVRGFTGAAISKRKFPSRRDISSWLSLCGTAFGSVGTAVLAAFTYHMLRRADHLTGLWVVSIFCGIQWLAGICYPFGANRPGPAQPESSKGHWVAVFKYPHAAGSLVGVLLSSFVTSCIYTGVLLHILGNLCIKPLWILFVWLTYFISPIFSLPLLHPLQLLLRMDALRMQLLGLLLSALTSGTAFWFQHKAWPPAYLLAAAVVQSTAAGLLQAFGRVLLLDCSPTGREGAFAAWFAWAKAAGGCGGFAVAVGYSSKVGTALGAGFWVAVAGVVVLVFGKVSHLGGAVAAGHVRADDSDKGSPASAGDRPGFQGSVFAETPQVRHTV